MRFAAALGALLVAGLLGGCTHLVEHSDGTSVFTDRTYEPTQLFRDFQTVAAQLRVEEKKSGANPYDGLRAQPYLDEGITLSNMACQTWLTALGKSDRDTQYGKNLLNIAGSLILGVAGINGSSASNLAKGALGITAANALIDAYRADILQGVISEIELKLKEGRALSAARARGAEGPRTHFLVKEYLVDYHASCSSNEIKRLLSKSLSEVKYSFDQATLTDAIGTAGTAKDNADLFQAIFGQGGSFDDASLVQVYGLLTGSAEVATAIAPVSPLASMAKVEYDKAAASAKTAIQVKLANLARSRELPSKLKALIKERADAAAAKTAQQAAEGKLKQALIDTRRATQSQMDSTPNLERLIEQVRPQLDVQTQTLLEQYRDAKKLAPAPSQPPRSLFPSITPVR